MNVATHKKLLCHLCTALMLLSTWNTAFGQTLIDFTLSEYTVDAPGGAPNGLTNGPFVATTVLSSDISAASVVGAGFGTGGNGSYAGELNWIGWNNGNLMRVNVTPVFGRQVDLSSLRLNIARNGTAAPDSLYIAVEGSAPFAGISGMAIHSGVDGALPLSGFEQSFDLSSLAPFSRPFTLTIGSFATGTGNLRINDIVLEGTSGASQVPTARINRQTGVLTLHNTSGAPKDLAGISITSTAGSLRGVGLGWTPVTGNYDENGNDSIDSNDPWVILASTATELSEAQLSIPAGDGGVLGTGQTLNLGSAWRRTPFEDIVVRVTDTEGVITSLPLAYDGTPVAEGDLDGDGDIDRIDWAALLSGLNAPSAATLAEAYAKGDLDGNLVTDFFDVLAFREAYSAANPLAGSLAMVPEPSGLALIVMGCFLSSRRRGSAGRQ